MLALGAKLPGLTVGQFAFSQADGGTLGKLGRLGRARGAKLSRDQHDVLHGDCIAVVQVVERVKGGAAERGVPV